MRQVFEVLVNELEGGKGAVLATITASCGSTPRKAGSRMAVRADGSICGTVGGGAIEYQSILAAGEAISQKTSFVREFCLSNSQAANIGMICGGTAEVYLQYLAPTKANIAFCREVLLGLEQNRVCELVLEFSDEQRWKMTLEPSVLAPAGFVSIDSDLAAAEPEAGVKKRRFVTSLVEAGIVYIFGGGHVAQELVPVLCHLDFRCVVIDDRAEFACPEVFPQAERTLVLDLEQLDEALSIRPCDYICIMTRGHQFDYLIQRQVLKTKPCYIGIMGSRNKIRMVTEKLLADGYTPEEIQTCHMPIGTDIKAETPAEIAISIAGELIAIRAAGRKAN